MAAEPWPSPAPGAVFLQIENRWCYSPACRKSPEWEFALGEFPERSAQGLRSRRGDKNNEASIGCGSCGCSTVLGRLGKPVGARRQQATAGKGRHERRHGQESFDEVSDFL